MGDRPALFVTRKLPDDVTARLARDYRATLNPDDRLYNAAELIAGAAGHDALLISSSEKMTAETLAILPDSVRAIATFSVGFEHIDLAAAKARGIVVTNTPDVLTDATADIAMLLILGAARRGGEGERMVRDDRWTGLGLAEMLGRQVSGKRLGIFGMGRIGRALARRARIRHDHPLLQPQAAAARARAGRHLPCRAGSDAATMRSRSTARRVPKPGAS